MPKKQYFGIKFPFEATSPENFFVDANSSVQSKVRSQLIHVIFTPKRQRLRLPEFGTDLIKYIFDTNDSLTWEKVKAEIKEAVALWIPNLTLQDIEVVVNENDSLEIYVKIKFSVTEGNETLNDEIIVNL